MSLRLGIVLCLLFSCLPVFGESWDELRRLNPGDRVRVLDTAGREHKGVFQAVSTDSISIEAGKSQVAIERLRVRRIEVKSNARRVRNALIGVGIGVAVAVTVDQTLGARLRNESNESGRAVTYLAPIALFGGIGAALPGYRTAYRAP